MQPLAQWAPGPMAGVLTDIDDTLTRDGLIESAALAALQALHRAGVPVIAITGRPAGWSEAFARSWPLLSIVAENGSLRLFSIDSVLHKKYVQPETERHANHRHLQAVLQAIEQQVPGAVRARDSAGRETDIAIDHSEFTHLAPQRIAQVVQLMRAAGLNATVSSIHINGWVGGHNKWTGAQWAVKELLGRDLAHERERWVYVGDSTNDQVMFQHLPLSVGVANIRRFASQLTHLPRYITEAERGAGFAEVAAQVLRSWGGPVAER
ncbi:MAG: HAD-IIB family hydrolase [Burkholderiaceae bacterium]|nr:HAD-IIB family hydrolase [Burkholderiaceae bacterium]